MECVTNFSDETKGRAWACLARGLHMSHDRGEGGSRCVFCGEVCDDRPLEECPALLRCALEIVTKRLSPVATRPNETAAAQSYDDAKEAAERRREAEQRASVRDYIGGPFV